MKRWEVKERTRNLRRKGLSYSEIRSRIPLAKSTVSNWCKDIKLTNEQIARLDRRKINGGYAGSLKGAKVNQEKRVRQIKLVKEIVRRDAVFLKR